MEELKTTLPDYNNSFILAYLTGTYGLYHMHCSLCSSGTFNSCNFFNRVPAEKPAWHDDGIRKRNDPFYQYSDQSVGEFWDSPNFPDISSLFL